MNRLTLKNISHSYGEEYVLDNINLSIKKGEFFTLLGPSGCGKTTLLRIVAGFIQPTNGAVYMENEDITFTGSKKRNVGVVFQNYALFPNMTVRENIGYGMKVKKIPGKIAEEKCNYYMELSGLQHLGERFIHQLSGGQQQRVAIARALAMEPQMLLMDEPMSNLDAALRITMREELRKIQKQTKITTLFITHDQQEALVLSDRIGVLNKGKLLQVGTPQEIYNQPNQKFVADFVGTCNCIPKTEFEIMGITCHSKEPYLLLRPEQFNLSRNTNNGKRACIKRISFYGVYSEYLAETDFGELKIIRMNTGVSEPEWKVGEIGYVSVVFGAEEYEKIR